MRKQTDGRRDRHSGGSACRRAGGRTCSESGRSPASTSFPERSLRSLSPVDPLQGKDKLSYPAYFTGYTDKNNRYVDLWPHTHVQTSRQERHKAGTEEAIKTWKYRDWKKLYFNLRQNPFYLRSSGQGVSGFNKTWSLFSTLREACKVHQPKVLFTPGTKQIMNTLWRSFTFKSLAPKHTFPPSL